MKKILTMLALLLAACGSGIEGTYSDPTGMAKYEFESGGKVYFSLLGVKTQQKYEIDGKHIKITTSSGNTQILTRLEDGSLEGPMGVKLKKQP